MLRTVSGSGNIALTNNRANSSEELTMCQTRSKNFIPINLIWYSYLLLLSILQITKLKHRAVKLGRSKADVEPWDTGFKSES